MQQSLWFESTEYIRKPDPCFLVYLLFATVGIKISIAAVEYQWKTKRTNNGTAHLHPVSISEVVQMAYWGAGMTPPFH